MNTETKPKLADLERYYFDEDTTRGFIDFLKSEATVIAPHKKGEASFSYEPVDKTENVVFDYPRTIQPLKKYFLPARETLLSFDIKDNQYKQETVEVQDRIFFGIHSYEMQGLLRLDYSFQTGNPESNYLTRREKARFIGIAYTPDEFHFSKSLGIDVDELEGFCLYLEPAEHGFIVFVVNEDGAELIKAFGKGQAMEGPVTILEREFKNQVKVHYNRMPQIFDHVYSSAVWDEVSKKCVGCGTCNLLCSTCYCFDVQDEIELDARSGKRERFWDGCMLNNFAEVAGGENFREKLTNRTRHRLHRKFKYITENSGELHCVGCGRCSRYCPADINIVNIINDLIDEYNALQKKQANLL